MRIQTISLVRHAIALCGIALISVPVLADETRPYTEGQVIEVTSVRTKPGMFDEYMKFLAGPYRQEQEEMKKMGLTVGYDIYAGTPRTPNDPDLYLVITYKNMAAFDGLMDKSEAIDKKVFGSLKQAEQGMVSREAIRTILGSEIMRELKLK